MEQKIVRLTVPAGPIYALEVSGSAQTACSSINYISMGNAKGYAYYEIIKEGQLLAEVPATIAVAEY